MITNFKATSTATTNLLALNNLGDPAVIATHDILNQRCIGVLCNLLPALVPNAATIASTAPDPHVAQLITHVADVSNNLRLDQEDQKQQQEDYSAPKSARMRFGEDITDMLLKLTGVDDHNDLPPIYGDLVGRKKDENEHLILQKALNRTTKELGIKKPLTASAAHVSTLKIGTLSGLARKSLEQVGLYSPSYHQAACPANASWPSRMTETAANNST